MPPPPLPNARPSWLYRNWTLAVAYVVAGLLVVAMAGLMGTAALAVLKGGPPRRASQRQWDSMAEVEAMVKGKAPDEVIEAVGRPNQAFGDAWKDGAARWWYMDRVYNRATGRHDRSFDVHFKDGKAAGAE